MKNKFFRYTRRFRRWIGFTGVALLGLLVAAVLAARWALPQIVERKDEIEAAINRVSPQPVRLGRLTAYWDGWHPGVQIEGVTVYAADGRTPALQVPEARLSLAWLPLLWREYRLHNLELVRPKLTLERVIDGRVRVIGLDLQSPAGAGPAPALAEWMLSQGRLAIRDGELTWIDQQDGGWPLPLTGVNLALRNRGERHRLDLSAVFPRELCQDCSFVADVRGNPLESDRWSGTLQVRAGALDVEKLPRIARERLPAGLRGRFDVQLTTRWRDGQPTRIEGQAAVNALVVPVKDLPTPLAVRELGGDVVWKAAAAGQWELDLKNLSLGLVRPAWSADRLRLVYGPDERRLEASHVDLTDLTAFVDKLRVQVNAANGMRGRTRPGDRGDAGGRAAPGAVAAGAVAPRGDGGAAVAGRYDALRLWSALKPVGIVNRLDLRLAGDWAAPRYVSLKAELDGFGLQTYGDAPGVQGLSGRLTATSDGGEFEANATQVRVTLPNVFRAPLEAARLRGQLAWQRLAESWQFSGDGLQLAVSDGHVGGDFTLHVPHDTARSPTLRLQTQFRNLNGAHAARYYPARHLSRQTLEWMESSFIGGEITRGTLAYDGPIREFPFAAGPGRFALRAQVRNGSYRFLPGWTPVRQAEVDVSVDRDQVRVTGQGRLGGLVARKVTVATERTPAGHEQVQVRTSLTGPVAETLRVLYQIEPGSPAAEWTHYLPRGLEASGQGELTLAVDIPFDHAPVRIDGEYRFRQASLREPATGAQAEGLEGHVRFSENGVRDSQLRARFLGGTATLTAGETDGQLLIHAHGQIGAEGLAALLGPRLAPHVDGSAAWNARWRAASTTGGTFQLEAALTGIRSRLPAPLDFPEGLPIERLVVRTDSSGPDNHVLALRAGTTVDGRIVFARQDGAWQLAGGRIAFGEGRAVSSRGRGLHLSARLDALDLDRWFPFLGRDGARDAPSWLARVSADVRALELFDRDFGRVGIDLTRDKDGWAGSLTGAAAAGQLRYVRRGPDTQLAFDLSTLTLPAAHAGGGAETDPRRLPSLTVRSKAFQYRDKPLGELDFAAQPVAGGWHITRLNLNRPETQLAVTGDWRYTGAQHRSEFDLRLTSSDFSQTLAALGIPDQISGGELNLTAQLSWPGAPAEWQAARLNGRAEFTAKNGRFLQLKQGAGRFFGFLDLSAIGRYLTLDFSPIFGQGFVYDRIYGKVTIERGNVYTDDFSLHGPSAKMSVRGRIGLGAEDFDLSLDVQPQLSDSLTIGSWAVFGPQVAATVLALQKIFKKEITERTRVNYVVKGPWDNPAVTRSLQEGAAGAKPAG